MLTDEEFPEGVTTGYENPVERLFVPLLRQAATYQVGFEIQLRDWQSLQLEAARAVGLYLLF